MALRLHPPLSHFHSIPSGRRKRPPMPTPPALRVYSSSSALDLDMASPTASDTPSQKLVIGGGRQLSGHVRISGSKNAALAVLAGTLCCSAGASVVRGVPTGLSDVEAMVAILRSVGARVEVLSSRGREAAAVVVEAGGVAGPPPLEPCAEAVGRTRAGFFVVGPLVGRFGAAEVALPGGCQIGARPVDIYVDGLRALGAVVDLRQGKLYAHAANGKGLVGGRFHLHFPSVGASKTLMMAAALAEGETVLSNVAREPEVVDLAHFLIASGAQIEGAGTSKLVIHGRKQLHGTQYSIIPDRIEAGTLMVAAAITRSCISLSPVIPCHLTSAIEKLSAAGCKITQTSNTALEVSGVHAAVGGLHGFNFKTSPFPGFPTDLQPQFMSLLTTCNGASIIEECIFERRMRHGQVLCPPQDVPRSQVVIGESRSGALPSPGCAQGLSLSSKQNLQSRHLKRIKAANSGTSCVFEHFHKVEELRKLGANIQVFGRTAVVRGKVRGSGLIGGQVTATDLRSGATLVLAGLAAEGITEVAGVVHVDRGYENLEGKLRQVGADITRVSTCPSFAGTRQC